MIGETEREHEPYELNSNLSNVRDGLSNTLLVREQSGLPIRANGKWTPWPMGAWAAADSSQNVVMRKDQPAVNLETPGGIYGFHRGGAQVVMCDGSVRFLSEGTASTVVFSLGTRDGGEAIAATAR